MRSVSRSSSEGPGGLPELISSQRRWSRVPTSKLSPLWRSEEGQNTETDSFRFPRHDFGNMGPSAMRILALIPKSADVGTKVGGSVFFHWQTGSLPGTHQGIPEWGYRIGHRSEGADERHKEPADRPDGIDHRGDRFTLHCRASEGARPVRAGATRGRARSILKGTSCWPPIGPLRELTSCLPEARFVWTSHPSLPQSSRHLLPPRLLQDR